LRYHIEHPTNPKVTAAYGWDPFLKFFAQIYRGQRPAEAYDATIPGYSDLAGALAFLGRHGFYDHWHVEAAHQQLRHTELEDLGPEIKVAAEILINFKLAAA